MLETNKLRDAGDEAARSLEQINIWQKELEAKEEKLKLLIREKNRQEQMASESKFFINTAENVFQTTGSILF